jgi:hypothetical protein
MRLPLRFLLAFIACAAATAAHAQAGNCDAIRAGIDAKIRASGASGYALIVVDADAKVEGKVIGSCELGTKKIVYATGTAATPAPAPAPREAPMLTECKDGTVTLGDCKK